MSVTLMAAYIAMQIGPFLALAFALPYVIYGYIRTKSVDVWKCTYFYSFCLYFLCAYFVTWLPLPTEETLAKLKPVEEYIQLVPFQSFFDIKLKSIFRDIAIILFNVLLTAPLGYFFRQFFGCSLKKTVLAGFLVSLLYEVTQLTGLFFIYPRPYRIFDVDDLIINTLGAYVGYVFAPRISRLLPRIRDTRNLRLVQGSEVAFIHRAIAAAIDFALVMLASVQLIVLIPALRGPLTDYSSLLRFPFFFVLVVAVAALYSLVFSDRTPGCRLTGLRLMTAYGKAAGRAQCLRRTLMLYVCVFAIPFWVLFFMNINTEYAGASSLIWMFLSVVLMMFAARNVLELSFNAVTNGSSMFYDRRAKTHLAYSTVSKRSRFGIRVVDILPLTNENVDRFSDEISQLMISLGIPGTSVTKMRLMLEWVMLEWKDAGLDGRLCELRLDKRLGRKALLLSLPGDDKTHISFSDEYVNMPDELNLKLETYYAGEKNICIIHIP